VANSVIARNATHKRAASWAARILAWLVDGSRIVIGALLVPGYLQGAWSRVEIGRGVWHQAFGYLLGS
jgi:hypothetical protein